MIGVGVFPVLLLLLILWLIFGRRRRRQAYRFAADGTIPYPTRQLDSGRTSWIGGAGVPTGFRPTSDHRFACFVTAAMLVIVVADLTLRYFGSSLVAYWALGFLALSVLAGIVLPVVKLPVYGLGQPRRRERGAPRGSGLLTILLLALLANGLVQATLRQLEFQPLDVARPHDLAGAIFAVLLTVSVVVVALRMFAERRQG